MTEAAPLTDINHWFCIPAARESFIMQIDLCSDIETFLNISLTCKSWNACFTPLWKLRLEKLKRLLTSLRERSSPFQHDARQDFKAPQDGPKRHTVGPNQVTDSTILHFATVERPGPPEWASFCYPTHGGRSPFPLAFVKSYPALQEEHKLTLERLEPFLRESPSSVSGYLLPIHNARVVEWTLYLDYVGKEVVVLDTQKGPASKKQKTQ